MKREDAKDISDKALAELKDSLAKGQSGQMKAFLAFAAKLHKYSWGNILMIFSQRPDATYVAGFKAWLSMGRHVKKGEKGIVILAPMTFKKDSADTSDGEESTSVRFRATHVFDVSQTEGDEIPQPNSVSGEPAEKLVALETVIANHGIALREDYLPQALAVSLKGEIVITPGLEPAERFAVLAHEFGHELLHGEESRKNDSKKVKETEAEAIAYVVSTAFGLDTTTRSSDYISLYHGDGETLSSSLGRIQKTASHIIQEVSVMAETMATSQDSASAT